MAQTRKQRPKWIFAFFIANGKQTNKQNPYNLLAPKMLSKTDTAKLKSDSY